ncbi:MAG TPA: CBS domain-containing protein [Bacillota bacterium]|nr:CBS domain-containing protein [Bacillota bacterium]HOR87214.1 CBS domain-containing protein [Bacillota bacterium]
MYIKNRMTKNPYTIPSSTTIADAVALFREKRFKRFPVVDNGKLVGVLTKGDIQTVSPTKATSLSIFEVNYFLSKITVKEAMTKKVITIEADCLLEEAAVAMRENKISTLPVLEKGKLVGIITESDIFDAFIDLLGFKDKGSRITIETKDVPGGIADISEVFSSLHINITHIAMFAGNGVRDLVIRSSVSDISEIEKRLNEKGYKIKHVLISK